MSLPCLSSVPTSEKRSRDIDYTRGSPFADG